MGESPLSICAWRIWISTTVTPLLMDAILSQDQLRAVNEKFNLDLIYNDASHYRAAQVIFSLWKEKEPISRDQVDGPAGDTQASDQDPEDIA
jgi:hypothetical protein